MDTMAMTGSPVVSGVSTWRGEGNLEEKKKKQGRLGPGQRREGPRGPSVSGSVSRRRVVALSRGTLADSSPGPFHSGTPTRVRTPVLPTQVTIPRSVKPRTYVDLGPSDPPQDVGRHALTRVAMASLRGIYFLTTLFLGSFFGSVFMLAPFLPLMLVSPAWYRWLTDRIVATWLTLPVALLEIVFGAKVVITGDGFIPGERSVIIMNHRTRLDWMFLWNCLLRYSYLRLEKICLKATLKAVPGFGWAMQVASFIFIHRKWEDDQRHVEAMLEYFCAIREPLQLLIFPEGTDLTANTRARSDVFAEKNGLQKYKYVLHPRTTGFTFIVESLRKAKCIWPVLQSMEQSEELFSKMIEGLCSVLRPHYCKVHSISNWVREMHF
ncbi:UNVERIFIED_CONTAM: hypothetical protein FKN15_040959 [Acipenser sinensis]